MMSSLQITISKKVNNLSIRGVLTFKFNCRLIYYIKTNNIQLVLLNETFVRLDVFKTKITQVAHVGVASLKIFHLETDFKMSSVLYYNFYSS